MSSASSSSSASPTAAHVSPVLSFRPWSQHLEHPEHPNSDEELEFELRRREMKKIQDARRRLMASRAGGGSAGGTAAGGSTETKMSSNSRMNACDINGEEFQIVCEELWIDFKSWVNHRENLSNCVSKARAVVASNWIKIIPVLVFLIWFRWYIGSGKEACSYGFGYGVFSFICEVLRYAGEFVAALILMFIGFCVGLLPIIVCVCFYEFKDAFPDPEEDDADADADADARTGHLKKE